MAEQALRINSAEDTAATETEAFPSLIDHDDNALDDTREKIRPAIIDLPIRARRRRSRAVSEADAYTAQLLRSPEVVVLPANATATRVPPTPTDMSNKLKVPQPGPARLKRNAGPDEWLAAAKECKYLSEPHMKQLCEIVKEYMMEGNFLQLIRHHGACR